MKWLALYTKLIPRLGTALSINLCKTGQMPVQLILFNFSLSNDVAGPDNMSVWLCLHMSTAGVPYMAFPDTDTPQTKCFYRYSQQVCNLHRVIIWSQWLVYSYVLLKALCSNSPSAATVLHCGLLTTTETKEVSTPLKGSDQIFWHADEGLLL